jgi:hypothetical protein
MGITPEIFMVDTGVVWVEFANTYPTVASLLDLADRAISLWLSGGDFTCLGDPGGII